MKLANIASAAIAVAAVGLIAAPIASATSPAEQKFLTVIADHGITWPQGKDQAVIDTGHAVCTDWQNGATVASELADLQGATHWSEDWAGFFIGAATASFCPQYESKLG